MSFGVRDAEAWLVELPADAAEAMLDDVPRTTDADAG
jgi:hypothetical protein